MHGANLRILGRPDASLAQVWWMIFLLYVGIGGWTVMVYNYMVGYLQFSIEEVRKTPSWPRSWADLSLLSLHTRRNVWANLHLLGRPDALARSEALVPGVLTQVQPRAVESFRRRFVYFTSNSPYRIYQAAPE
jgi:hypothetical protein